MPSANDPAPLAVELNPIATEAQLLAVEKWPMAVEAAADAVEFAPIAEEAHFDAVALRPVATASVHDAVLSLPSAFAPYAVAEELGPRATVFHAAPEPPANVMLLSAAKPRGEMMPSVNVKNTLSESTNKLSKAFCTRDGSMRSWTRLLPRSICWYTSRTGPWAQVHDVTPTVNKIAPALRSTADDEKWTFM